MDRQCTPHSETVLWLSLALLLNHQPLYSQPEEDVYVFIPDTGAGTVQNM